MVLESNGHGVTVVLTSNTPSSSERMDASSAGCWRVMVMVLESNGYGVRE
jgi:hypothetical protein